MKKILSYPARYSPDKIGDREGFFLEFIDVPNAFTQGYTIEELYEMGQDVLSLILEDYIEQNKEVPLPSSVEGENILFIEPLPRVALPIIMKLIRRRRKMSQKDVASKLGVSYQTYQKMERGQVVNPTLSTMEKLARVFDMKISIGFTCRHDQANQGKWRRKSSSQQIEELFCSNS